MLGSYPWYRHRTEPLEITMNTFRKIAPLALIGLALAALASGCRTIAAEGTPQELQAIPTSQSVLLEVAIEAIVANNPDWVDPSTGLVLRDAILAVLRADKNAWDELDRFYNPTAASTE